MKLGHDADRSLYQLQVRSQLARRIVVIVLKPNSYMASHKQCLCGGRELSRSDCRHTEHALRRQMAHHEVQCLARIWHRPLEASFAAEHHIDEVRRLVI